MWVEQRNRGISQVGGLGPKVHSSPQWVRGSAGHVELGVPGVRLCEIRSQGLGFRGRSMAWSITWVASG